MTFGYETFPLRTQLADYQFVSLVDFLLARIEEDQVKRGVMREWHTLDCETVPDPDGYTYPCDCGVPERVLAECGAKRRIVAEHPHLMNLTNPVSVHGCDTCKTPGWCPTLRALALPFADHPEYREEWAL